VRLAITPGQQHDATVAGDLLDDMKAGQMLLADKAYDADWIREMVNERGAWANIPPKSNRKNRSASVHISTRHVTGSSASLTNSSTSAASQRDTTSSAQPSSPW